MVETIELSDISKTLLNLKSKTPLEVLIQSNSLGYRNLVNSISISNVSNFSGSHNEIVKLDNDRILFANTYEKISTYENINKFELDALINIIFEKISVFSFEEDISIFHIDKILTNTKNLVKLSEMPKLPIDYIVSTNEPVVVNISNSSISMSNSDLTVINLHEYSIQSLLVKELTNSLIVLKIAEGRLIDVGDIMSKLSLYSNILKYDKKNRLVALNLKYIVNLEEDFILSVLMPRTRYIVSIDRTDWLSSILK